MKMKQKGKLPVLLLLISLFGLSLISYGCGGGGGGGEYSVFTVSGYVYSESVPTNQVRSATAVYSEGGPVAQAEVIIDHDSKYKTYTESDGYFKIRNVPRGGHDLIIVKRYSDEVTIDRTININVEEDYWLQEVILPNPVMLNEAQTQDDIGSVKVTITWNESMAEDYREYKLYRHTSSGLDETTGTLIHVATSIVDTEFDDNIPYSSSYYYRVFVMNEFGKLGGSNIIHVQTMDFNISDLELTDISEDLISVKEEDYFLDPGEIQWCSFDGIKGQLYKVAWYDNWWAQYTAQSIYVTGYQEDQSTQYFPRQRLIQAVGSPKSMVAEDSEKVYLKVEGYDPTVTGTFGIKIDRLNTATATKLTLGEQINFIIDIGEAFLFYFDGVAGSTYTVTFVNYRIGTGYLGPLATVLSVYRENINHAYLYEVHPGVVFENGEEMIDDFGFYTFQAIGTERVYLVVTGSYWWDPMTTTLRVTESQD